MSRGSRGDCAFLQALPLGIQLLPDYISAKEESDLVTQVDGGIWSNELSRRVQHYGYRYDYRKRAVDPSMRLGPLPNWLQRLALRLHEDGIFAQTPDQVIVNEYLPGQGIAAHVDCEPCFGPVTASLSLCAPVPMVFGSRRTREVAEVDLPPRSLLVLSGEGRYEWTHAILARKTDAIDGESRERARRVSLTFRTVISINLEADVSTEEPEITHKDHFQSREEATGSTSPLVAQMVSQLT